ncbi:BREX-1 system phosphatase PglZ type A [Chryseoglobus frigidaquae]|nr:BREX-1 system phosphatase PglZ type A [Microcella frigidaquae]
MDDRHVVFWHDPAGEYDGLLDDLSADLDNVKVIRVVGDEFAVKSRLLQEERRQNFIVYLPYEYREDLSNWLLDLEFAYGRFTADKEALLGDDLGLKDQAARAVITEYPGFFNAADRRERLKKRLLSDDPKTLVLAKMCAVLLKTEQHSLSELTRQLLIEAAEGEGGGLKLLNDFGLLDFYWGGVHSTYGYASESPTIDDFVLWLFRSAHEGFATDTAGRNIAIDYSRWRDSKTSSDQMGRLAQTAEEALQIASSLENRAWGELLGSDAFESIDRKIISDLAAGVADKSIAAHEVAEAVRRRQTTFWFGAHEAVYTALLAASELLTAIDAFAPTMSGFDDGVQRYAADWSRIDQLYRHFNHAVRNTEHTKPLEPLVEQVENFYSNKYVGPLATAWQVQVDAVAEWKSSTVRAQTAFFSWYVKPQLDKGRRVIVIISDALRYEIADELRTRLRRFKEDKSKLGFDASIEPTLGVLPSYTQLGMAALLPHQTIGFTGVRAFTEVDGKKADGTANRGKILEPFGGAAIQSEDLVGLTVKELRAKTQQQQLMYVYHNLIDATGDKIGTERQVFGAAARAIDELVLLVSRFAKAEVGSIFITADHGFLFQDRELDDAGYLSTEPQGDEIHDRDRRRVIGRGLKADPAFRHFTPAQLGLSSDYEVLIPKGTKRMKLQGSGARYVHGGATLQEIVVPVISVTYADSGKTAVRPVNVTIQQKSPNITTAILAVDIHQSEPVSDKVQGRELRAGIYLGEELLSNEVVLKFNSESSDPSARYLPARMSLRAEADQHNNKDVELRLEEQIPNTTQWRLVTKAVYKLKRSFQADF